MRALVCMPLSPTMLATAVSRLGRGQRVAPGCPWRAAHRHLLIGPSGVFVIDSKQYSGCIQQTPDGHVWHNHYPMNEQLATVRAEARAVEAILGVPVIPLPCVHGASVQWGGLHAQGVAIVPVGQLGGALGADAVLSAEQVVVLAGTAQAWLRPPADPVLLQWVRGRCCQL
jgi:hypothetical protein